MSRSGHDERAHGESDERFADWVDGRLSRRELAKFEAEMATDPAFRNAAETYHQHVEQMRDALAEPLTEEEGGPADLSDRILAAVAGGGVASSSAGPKLWRRKGGGADDRSAGLSGPAGGGRNGGGTRSRMPMLLSAAAAATVIGGVWMLQSLGTDRPTRRDTAAVPLDSSRADGAADLGVAGGANESPRVGSLDEIEIPEGKAPLIEELTADGMPEAPEGLLRDKVAKTVAGADPDLASEGSAGRPVGEAVDPLQESAEESGRLRQQEGTKPAAEQAAGSANPAGADKGADLTGVDSSSGSPGLGAQADLEREMRRMQVVAGGTPETRAVDERQESASRSRAGGPGPTSPAGPRGGRARDRGGANAGALAPAERVEGDRVAKDEPGTTGAEDFFLGGGKGADGEALLFAREAPGDGAWSATLGLAPVVTTTLTQTPVFLVSLPRGADQRDAVEQRFWSSLTGELADTEVPYAYRAPLDLGFAAPAPSSGSAATVPPSVAATGRLLEPGTVPRALVMAEHMTGPEAQTARVFGVSGDDAAQKVLVDNLIRWSFDNGAKVRPVQVPTAAVASVRQFGSQDVQMQAAALAQARGFFPGLGGTYHGPGDVVPPSGPETPVPSSAPTPGDGGEPTPGRGGRRPSVTMGQVGGSGGGGGGDRQPQPVGDPVELLIVFVTEPAEPQPEPQPKKGPEAAPVTPERRGRK